ncbi:MAG: PAS domain-containing sensor histidine kinase, partial [Planctomycetota bacterium]
VGEMAAAVAHEVKNPLAGIGGAVGVIGREFPEGDPRAGVVSEIQRQVKRLDVIIRDLLTFARPTVPRFGRIELAGFVERVLRVLREEPVLFAHRIETRIPPDLALRSDPQLFENILINLLLNAGEALAGRPGRILLEAGERNGLFHLDVQDDGPGIPPEVFRNIFKPFFTTKHRGTGLGLTIVRKLTEVMGGRVEVETEEGKGTRFTVLLPQEGR